MFADKHKEAENKSFEDFAKQMVEKSLGGFGCVGCGRRVMFSDDIGTKHRNHCPYCLSSKHVDEKVSGDRESSCNGVMVPIAITFKKEGLDKYGKEKKGDVMIVHECSLCGEISINRIAADDDEGVILSIFSSSKEMDEGKKKKISDAEIDILESDDDKKELYVRLFGKGIGTF